VGTSALLVDATTLAPGITTAAFKVTHPGLAGNDVNVFQCDATAGDPYFTLGQVAVNNGGLFQYKRSTNVLNFGVHGGAGTLMVDNGGNVSNTQGSITSQNGNLVAQTGVINCANNVFQCQGNNGISGTFDISGGNTQITFVGGIITAFS
jgi:hypothetical protein